MTNLQQKFDTLEASLTTRLDSILVGQNAFAEAILLLAQNIGDIGACLCEELASAGPGGEPAPGENDPPAEGCTNYARIERVQSWQLQAEPTIDGVPCKAWAPIFPYQADLQGWRPHITVSSGRRAHAINQLYNPIFYCLVWNFAGGTAPVRVYRDTSSSSYEAMANATIGLQLSNGITGSFAEDFAAPAPSGQQNPETNRYIQWIFVFPATITMPPKNAFLRYPVQG